MSALLISFTSYLAIVFVKQEIDVDIWHSVRLQLLAAIIMAVVGLLGLSFWGRSLTRLLVGGLIVGFSYLVALAIFGHERIKTEIVSLRN